jgi:hypothetical protein
VASEPLTIEQVLSLLAVTPTRLTALTAGLVPTQLHIAPNQDEWSANDVLAHLRACADVWGNCITRIIAEDKPALRGISPRAWIKKTDYRELEFGPSLHSFATQRAELLAILQPLPPEGWSRTATVKDMVGKVFERTVLDYGQRLARHEQAHLEQIERLAATMQR